MSDKETGEAANSGVEGHVRSGRRGQATASTPQQIDISQALEAPVRMKRDGVMRPVDAYEAMLRQHVRKSLIDKSVPSMQLVLGEAEKHKLIKEPPTPPRSGTFVVPKDLPEDVQRQIFKDPHYGTERGMSMYQMMGLILRHVTFERLLRCFNGR